jgi:RHH-type proline utilization regulon transcriptional repressor/proline dehydrogenase/delta 1-pyrroline-5-carboxylate dehydrogenase
MDILRRASRATNADGLMLSPGVMARLRAGASPIPAAYEPAASNTEVDLRPQTDLRAAISLATYRAETACMATLLALARLDAPAAARAHRTAAALATGLRAERSAGPVEPLLREYALSAPEGVALMCLAEALLRIPDAATRDDLIRDKIGRGDWQSHLGASASLFVNATSWGLMLTGKLTATNSEAGLGAALTRLIGRGGEPVIRAAVQLAMRVLGQSFVCGQTIEEALTRARTWEAKGFTYSYDMLGEAAATAADAARYYAAYEGAIHAIGAAARGADVRSRPGISIKLSALHPRYERAQYARVMGELVPRLLALTALAKHYDIGMNIDAEEASRLDISLDILAAICAAPALAGWHGIGFVIQAYGRRALRVVDHVIDLAGRSGHRLMVRLVKGAYWDSEIKRAQAAGLPDFPVFTRKVHTDVSYLACARRLLAAGEAVYPQFATHNAATVGAVLEMAGNGGDYEFQCLYGMGEPLYAQVVGPAKLGRRARIYAPVGPHSTLLAYLVRRLLENGANTSFVNQLADPLVSIEALLADPVAAAVATGGSPHPKIAAPADIFPGRLNAAGTDLNDEPSLAALLAGMKAETACGEPAGGEGVILNPADPTDIVGAITPTPVAQIGVMVTQAAQSGWPHLPAGARADVLRRAADLFEARTAKFITLLVREAGKTLPAAIGELREAVDFLRYYAADVAGWDGAQVPLGVVAAISPWNFPLAIFTGQVAAALAAGNAVVAKPAPETPLVAAAAVDMLWQAGVPRAALGLVIGGAAAGEALVADACIAGVLFTGSTAAARAINTSLAGRLRADGAPVVLVAETGGQNAMVVDSSALPEQAVADVLASAFDSAGQRCSALRVLIVQEEVADGFVQLLRGAMAELVVGPPAALASDIGPVISAAAAARLRAHVAALRDAGCAVHERVLPAGLGPNFVAPTVIEIDHVSRLGAEMFGPVLHVWRVPRSGLAAAVRAVNALGYGLTFGVHSRIDETIAAVCDVAVAGNMYVNRNMIGAVVGAQPFGGRAASGTGPKAGGPLTLHRLLAAGAPGLPVAVGGELPLPGPVGEENRYRLHPRGAVLCVAAHQGGLARQRAACEATGNRAIVAGTDWSIDEHFDIALYDGDAPGLMALQQRLAARVGAIVPILTPRADGTYAAEMLVHESCLCVNTAAAGGNASLMMVG